MWPRLLLAWITGASLLNLVSARPQCGFKCNTCAENSNYEIDGDTGICYKKHESDVRFFLLGSLLCGVGGDDILDETTCLNAGAGAENPSPLVLLEKPFLADITWNNATDGTGCRISASPTGWLKYFHDHTIGAQLCLPRSSAIIPLVSIILGLLLGCSLAFVEVTFKRKCGKKGGSADDPDKKDKEYHRLLPGCSLKAAQLKNTGAIYAVALIYRCCQVLANACLPAITLIFIGIQVWAPLYIIFYFVPNICQSGREGLRKSVYMVAPPGLSLFGIDPNQINLTRFYFFDGIRPFLWIGCNLLIAYSWDAISGGGQLMVNPSGFFRSALMEDWGPVVLHLTILGTVLGTFLFSFMTMLLVLQDTLQGYAVKPISLAQDRKKMEKVFYIGHHLANELQQLDDEHGEDFDDLKAAIWAEYGGSKFNGAFQTYKGIAMAGVPIGSTVYKVWLFTRAGRVFVTVALLCIVSHALCLVFVDGTVTKALKNLHRSERLGVQTSDFFKMIEWSKIGAGVLTTMLTVYGLSLSSTKSWFMSVISLGFLAKSVADIGLHALQMVDCCMYTSDDLQGDEQRIVYEEGHLLVGDSDVEDAEDDSVGPEDYSDRSDE
jgi:hypothetical protein